MKKLTKKEKKISANKFKTILAQPLPTYWPEIKDEDKEELQTILSEIFQDEEKSGEVKKNCVTIGLSSSLRALQNDKASCVIFSADIKPKFVVNQAINLVLAKHRSTIALIVPLLEDLTEKHFGLKTIAFAIFKNSLPQIDAWATNKAKLYPVPPILEQYYNNKNEMPKIENSETMERSRGQLTVKQSTEEPVPELTLASSKNSKAAVESKNKLGDYISFAGKGGDIGTVEMDVDLETDKVLLINKIKKFTTISKINDSPMTSEPSQTIQTKLKKLKKKKAGSFVKKADAIKESAYISLKMTKIQKNPDKMKKKKQKTKQ